MGRELQEMRQEIKLIAGAITELSKNQNQMIPKLDWCMEELKGINTEQGFVRTLLSRLETTTEFYAKDLKNLGTKVEEQGGRLTELVVADGKHVNDLANLGGKVKELELRQMIHTGIRPADPGRWAKIIDFLACLPAYLKPLKPFLPWVVTGLTVAGSALWELLR